MFAFLFVSRSRKAGLPKKEGLLARSEKQTHLPKKAVRVLAPTRGRRAAAASTGVASRQHMDAASFYKAAANVAVGSDGACRLQLSVLSRTRVTVRHQIRGAPSSGLSEEVHYAMGPSSTVGKRVHHYCQRQHLCPDDYTVLAVRKYKRYRLEVNCRELALDELIGTTRKFAGNLIALAKRQKVE